MNTKVFTPVLMSLTALAALLAGGCQEIEKRSYDVSVKNDSDRPVTVWITKTGPVYESGWKSPEDLTIDTRGAGERIAGNVIRPGETQDVAGKEGKFSPHSRAVLRVYLGEHGMSELLAMSHDSPDRRDFDLAPLPGTNTFRVYNHDGMTIVEPGTSPMSSDRSSDSEKK